MALVRRTGSEQSELVLDARGLGLSTLKANERSVNPFVRPDPAELLSVASWCQGGAPGLEREGETMQYGAQPQQFTGSSPSRAQHICAFFNGMDEHYRVLRSFVRDGFEQGDKAFHLIDPKRYEDHLKRLADAGIDVEEAMASGQLEVHPWEDGPLHGERFDQDSWLAGFEDALRSGPRAGYTRTRFLAQMEWALVDLPGVDDLIEFEVRVNDVVPRYHNAVICAYDVTRFSAKVTMDALRTHPVVIIGGLLQENPFYVPPDQFLLEVRRRRSGPESTTTTV